MPVTKIFETAKVATFKSRNTASYFLASPPANVGTLSETVQVFPLVSSVTYPDYVKRDWRALIRNRTNATTDLSGIKYRVLYRAYADVFFYKTFVSSGGPSQPAGRTCKLQGVPCAESPAFYHSDPGLVNRTAAAWLAKARSKQRPFMAGVALGEIRETIHMIRHPLQALYKSQYEFSRKVKHMSEKRLIFQSVAEKTAAGRGKSARDKARRLSDLWLEYSFGWKPLYGDIDSACEALARAFSSFPVERVNMTQSSDGFYSTQTIGTTENSSKGGFVVSTTSTRYGKVSVRIKGAIKIRDNRVSSALGSSVSDLIQDIVPTVWELIPYSWMVDYFLNIQQVIEASQFVRTDIAWAQITTRRYGKLHNVESYAKPNATQGVVSPLTETFRTRHSQYAIACTSFVRGVYTGAYVPALEFKIPGVGTKWLNLAALVSSFGSSNGRARR